MAHTRDHRRPRVPDDVLPPRQGVVVDDVTGRITFHLRKPDPQFLDKLTLLVVPTPKGTPMTTLTTPLPGTGPYRIAWYAHNKPFSLERNPYVREWSAPAQPAGFLDAITWVKVPDTQAAADAVLQGRADLAELTPFSQVRRLRSVVVRRALPH